VLAVAAAAEALTAAEDSEGLSVVCVPVCANAKLMKRFKAITTLRVRTILQLDHLSGAIGGAN